MTYTVPTHIPFWIFVFSGVKSLAVNNSVLSEGTFIRMAEYLITKVQT